MGQETMDIATLAGGCFWCLEAVYDQVKGVQSVESGYIGGQVDAPTYEQVCSGHTGHAEAVRITFDPRLVTFRDLLNVFFVIHDPTTRNRQGNDIGTQYRSGIFYHSPEQQQIAQEVIAAVTRERVYPNPIVTEVVPATRWYEAEAYHQDFYRRNPAHPYIVRWDKPKVAAFRAGFPSLSR